MGGKMFVRHHARFAVLAMALAGSCTLAVDNRQLDPECDVDDDCNDGDTCNGEETCDTAARRCVTGAPLVCEDTDACTTDACDEDLGCTYAFLDVDGDTFAPGECEATGPYAGQGGDCDDTNSSRAPGAAEQCNGVNDDCDDSVDEEVVNIPCYRDRDGLFDCAGRDGTDATSDFTAFALIHPNPKPSGQPFCVSGAAYVMSVGEPGSYTCAAGTGTPSFDYDCDGLQERSYLTAGHTTCGTPPACNSGGWTTAGVPACGEIAQYRTCAALAITSCNPRTGSRTQLCELAPS
jgi:hypothetical protein